MAYPEVIIPPSVAPATGLELTLQDDLTVEFAPRFSRGTTQRQSFGDPIWRARISYRSLRSSDRALVEQALARARGGAANIRLTPGRPLRGSFPATELLTNNDFSNGTTGYTAGPAASIAVLDRTLRVLRTGPTAGDAYASVTASAQSQYAPYSFRAMVASVNGVVNAGPTTTNNTEAISASDASASPGLRNTVVLATASSAPTAYLDNSNPSGSVAGDYYEVSWASYARCLLIDNPQNALLYSDQLDNAAWTKDGASITANSQTAPDGTSTMDALVEDGATSAHRVGQSITVSSSALDISASFCVKAGTRSWVYLEISDNSTHWIGTYVNLATGALGTAYSGGSNITNARFFVRDMGSGIYRIHAVARKSGTQTSIYIFCGAANADNSGTYTGVSLDVAAYFWRGASSISSVPFLPAQTTSAASTGTSQTGRSLNVKGLPVSTSGLLLAGDFFEINGELKQCTASLDSDAAGLGVLQFGPGLVTSPADNDPVIINNPMGRFRIVGDPRRVDQFGVYLDVDLELAEAGP